MGVLGAQALFNSAPVSVGMASNILRWGCDKRWFATKGKSIAHVIRWNTENKLLFGSKHKSASKKTLSASEATKRKTKPQRVKIDQKTKFRLEEMYMVSASGGGGAETRAFLLEERSIENLQPVQPVLDQDFYPEKFWEEDTSGGKSKTVSELDDFLSARPLQEKGHIEVPKILPVPKSRTTDAGFSEQTVRKNAQRKSKTKPSQTPAEGVSLESQHKELEFVLRCPLFPEQLPTMATPGLEFCSRVESFGLRVLPTVKTILGKTRPDLSNFFLQRWREKMIQELGEEGFKKHQEANIWRGVNLHACVQQYLSGTPLEDIQIQETNRGHWTSISDVLPRVTEVEALESNISHPWLHYKGTVDCVAKYKNTLCVIDWKTANKPKPLLSNLYDDPLQVVAYMGAINHCAEFKSKFGVVDQAAIVVAYPNGEAAHVHMLSRALCLRYWQQWCQRLHQYWETVFVQKNQ